MIMEFVDGETLAEHVKRGPIPSGEALAYIDQVLGALAYAHAEGVIHRDIKPANMMLTADGVVKLTDFGVARSQHEETLTATGTTTGSLAYMSPEQINGAAVDARSDLYSLGISLYEMVTGRRPFRAASDFALMSAQLKEQPRPPIELRSDLSPRLNAIILTAIAKDPSQRFQSASEFRKAVLEVQQVSAPAEAASTSAPTVVMGHAAPAPSQPSGGAPAAQAVPAPQRTGMHPGWLVAFGGALVIVAMVATGVYLRRANAEPGGLIGTPPTVEVPQDSPASSPSSSGGQEPASTTSIPPSSAAPSASEPAPQNIPSSEPSGDKPPSSSPEREPRVSGPRTSAQGSQTQESGATRQSAAEPVTPGRAPDVAVDIDQLETEIDQLLVRAGGVERGLNTLQQQQAAQGVGLRGDMVVRQESMKLNLSMAQQAVERRDTARAQRFKALAERDVEALERFLGR
jgi:serine/threonine-protein kinase